MLSVVSDGSRSIRRVLVFGTTVFGMLHAECRTVESRVMWTTTTISTVKASRRLFLQIPSAQPVLHPAGDCYCHQLLWVHALVKGSERHVYEGARDRRILGSARSCLLSMRGWCDTTELQAHCLCTTSGLEFSLGGLDRAHINKINKVCFLTIHAVPCYGSKLASGGSGQCQWWWWWWWWLRC